MQNFPLELEGENLKLIKLNVGHLNGLKLISIDERIWEFLPRKIHSTDDFDAYNKWIFERIDNGFLLVYTIIDKQADTIIGSTGFLNYDKDNRKIEIGGTWLTPNYWGSKFNLEAKYLLLNLCFAEKDIVRVELKTRETNIRSQKAIEKLGCLKEGILRWDRINDDGTFRNTILYSIIKPEWQTIKNKLEIELSK